ncbi:hypothetical protein ACLB2K_011344 [Fragaria x ananassa]
MTGRQLVTSPESQESSPSTSVNTSMKLLSYLKREKLKVPQKKARQEEEEEDDTEEEEVEQYLVEMRALEVEEIEKDEKEDEDEDLEKLLPPVKFDCGPFVLHYMEAMCAGLDPNQEGGNQMRKKMLEEFAKLN